MECCLCKNLFICVCVETRGLFLFSCSFMRILCSPGKEVTHGVTLGLLLRQQDPGVLCNLQEWDSYSLGRCGSTEQLCVPM